MKTKTRSSTEHCRQNDYRHTAISCLSFMSWWPADSRTPEVVRYLPRDVQKGVVRRNPQTQKLLYHQTTVLLLERLPRTLDELC